MRKLTIVDVAREAGVSIKTVSRVLNHQAGVGPQTRARVADIIKAHDFKPNAAARALPGARNYNLGFLTRSIYSHYYFNGLHAGVMRACRRHGYHMVLETIEDFVSDGKDAFVRRLRASHFDALILAPPVSDMPEIMAILDDMEMGYVRISPTVELERAPFAFMNDQDASYDIMDHLWGLGHRQIAYLGFRDTGASAERYAGYARFFRDKGLAPPYPRTELPQTTSATAFRAGEELVTRKDRPTAIFAATDFLAMGVMAAAAKHRLIIPSDLSLVGFDDSPGSESVWPPLTTIRQPIEEIGEAAVDLLVAGLGGDLADRTKTARRLDYSLVVRESTAPPPLAK
ncbi:LacI family transcriptional regulator [Asticcacaulis sp. AC460]|uniref:LacI family DNA-binding transcriptional regulator n=1 Tax=Asticcacaulis sp. AC460 TaxID=1282360 RepID=UPI0003C3CF98|nr:LacI family DNA-binding transcriptional regulator [Asticcacaulis sp. AC460]ESQ91482.1 LacI family transcriptional regulator [Asticcacaulis sp. AC460]